MIKSLYKQFQYWSEEGSVYIISDPHFGDTDMNWRWNLISKDWPFAVLDWINKEYTAECIASYIIWNINITVHKGDTLVILGDVGDIEYVKQIRCCNKILIKGNHDSGSKNYQRKQYFSEVPKSIPVWQSKLSEDFVRYLNFPELNDTKIEYHDNRLFNEVYEGPLFIGEKILLSHEPIFGLEDLCLNIHGHVHGVPVVNDFGHINVVAEAVDFIPLSLGRLINGGALSSILGIHRCTIDRATERKNGGKTV